MVYNGPPGWAPTRKQRVAGVLFLAIRVLFMFAIAYGIKWLMEDLLK